MRGTVGNGLFFLQGQTNSLTRQNNIRAKDRNLQLSEIFRQGLPYGLLRLDVPNPSGSLESSTPRLAVLDTAHRLHIFGVDGTKLTEEFALRPGPDPLVWDTLEGFPSDDLPGVVLWSSAEETHSEGIIICYLAGKAQIVFRGSTFFLADIDFDGIPEILEYLGSDYEPKLVMLWTWNGHRFVKVKQIAIGDLYSKGAVAAIRAAKAQPK